MKDIQFTFGIITTCDNDVSDHLKDSINSIIALNIPECEIIVVSGGLNLKNNQYILDNKIKVIDFNSEPYITRKKNLITSFANYENIVYLHDYIKFDLNWYDGFKQYGDDFKACMTQIKNADDTRYRDHVLFPYHHCTGGKMANDTKQLWEYSGIENNESMIPYDENRFSKFQYFSGAYWIAKKSVMLEIPLNENIKIWGAGEDVDFSQRFSSKYNFSMNPFSTVHLLKWKQDAFGLIRPECLEKCIEFIENNK